MGIREECLSAVGARLEQVSAERDVYLILEADVLAGAQRLADVLQDDDGDLQARYVLGWFHSFRYQALPEGQDSQDSGCGNLPEAALSRRRWRRRCWRPRCRPRPAPRRFPAL
jgi:hypothetical protein